MRVKLIGIYAVLITANLLVWLWALLAFDQYPLLLGTSFLAYSFGLRHAVDADHIAAIDNVTRELMQQGKQPVGLGFFFSLGHSTVVVLAAAGIALTAGALQNHFEPLKEVGSLISTSVSAAFLFAVALANMFILVALCRTFRELRRSGHFVDEELSVFLSRRGLLGRLLRPLFRVIGTSWHMYPLGLLFGLGFDTATEIGLLGVSAAEASKGLSIWSIMVFPALFTAGMSLVDTTDSVLMVCAYGWAFVKPVRKLYYNVTVTAVSVLVAVIIGGIEVLGLVGSQLGLEGSFWSVITALNDNFGTLGYVIIAIFAASWVTSMAIYRLKGYDKIEPA
ncbi:MAG TPA: HoxN/HupN/NixA family nickel/cobalt transporter [Stellaceae bacterium]